MTKRKYHMYPGGHQSDYMLDGRLYPAMLMHGRHDQAPPKICGVCGDRAKSLHFGGMACDSCKAFFRRSVQNEAYKHFRCAYESSCPIDMSTRKSCQSCRFTKCEEIGMEKTWVMTEEERAQQVKIRLEKKRQKQEDEERRRQAQEHRLKPFVAQLSDRHLYLSAEDIGEIDHLVRTFYEMYQSFPVPSVVNIPPQQCPSSRVVDLFVTSVSRLVAYVFRLPRFKRLEQGDQKILLKDGVLAMVILRGAMCYEEGQSSFSMKAKPKDDSAPKVDVCEIKPICSQDLFDSHYKFLRTIKNMNLDEPTLMLLQMVVLYSSDRMGLSDTAAVSSTQEFYTDLVRRYMNWWYGEENARLLYPRMLHRLADLRTLTEAHNMKTVRLTDWDLGKMSDEFKKMGLNPYPAYPEFLQGQTRVKSEPDRRVKGSERAVPTPIPERPLTQRSTSLPGYACGLGRYPAGAATVPQGAEAAMFQAHAQYGVAGYPGEVYGGSPVTAGGYPPQQWNPAFQDLSSAPPWVQPQRGPAPNSSGGVEDFDALLGLDAREPGKGQDQSAGREGTRMKTEPDSPMLSPTMTSPQPQMLPSPLRPQLAAMSLQLPTSQHTAAGYVTSQAMTSPQYVASGQPTPFAMFQHQGYDPGRHDFSESPGGYQGSYSGM